MPRLKLTKKSIDTLAIPAREIVYWDAGCPGFGLKITPAGRKVFIVLYRTGGSGSRLRKYTIGPYGRVTLHQARIAAQKVFAAKLEGRDPASEKRDAKRRTMTDRIEHILEAFIAHQISKNRSGWEISRLLRREIGTTWANRTIHDVNKRDVIEVISAIEQRGAPIAANKALKSIKTFFHWCVGRAILNQSPANGIPLPSKETSRDRVLTDEELSRVILAARQIGAPFGGVVELLALTGQRRDEVAQATWAEFDLKRHLWILSRERTKNGKVHTVNLSEPAMALLKMPNRQGPFVFSRLDGEPFNDFSRAKRELDRLSGVDDWRIHDLRRTCVSGIARLGISPHVADKILNHQSGTISGVAAVYQRHDFLHESKDALERWGTHVRNIVDVLQSERRTFCNADPAQINMGPKRYGAKSAGTKRIAQSEHYLSPRLEIGLRESASPL